MKKRGEPAIYGANLAKLADNLANVRRKNNEGIS